jgi:predicted Zn-dependent protease
MSGAMRIVATAAALLVVAWFALGAYQSHEVARATAAVAHGHLTRDRARRADAALDSAATLNPDRAVDVLRAQVAIADGQATRGEAILNRVLAAEPQDLDAWIALADALPQNSRRRQQALLHILSLAPVVKKVG